MNDKDIKEIRRHLRPGKSELGRVYGCYVDDTGKPTAEFEESIAFMPEDEAERFFALVKKAVSGSMGKTLLELEFTAKQVMEGDHHKLLSLLRESALKDAELRRTFFQRVSESFIAESGYVILLAYDVYDVPFRAKDDTPLDDLSDQQFSYFICAVCPVKQTNPSLGFHLGENRLRSTFQGLTVSPPEAGFMFPLFDERAANIYSVLYHIKNAANNHPELIEGVFGLEPPMPASEQKVTFGSILSESLKDRCEMEVVQAVHEQLVAVIEQHRESRDPEQLLISKHDITAALESCGISTEDIHAFESAFDEGFGQDAELPPENIIDSRQYVITTPDSVTKVAPDQSSLIETRVIDGRKYILIPAGTGVEVNGISVCIGGGD